MEITYKGEKYTRLESGWVNDKNLTVPTALQMVLTKMAKQDTVTEETAEKVVQPKPKRRKRKPKGIKVFDFIDS